MFISHAFFVGSVVDLTFHVATGIDHGRLTLILTNFYQVG